MNVNHWKKNLAIVLTLLYFFNSLPSDLDKVLEAKSLKKNCFSISWPMSLSSPCGSRTSACPLWWSSGHMSSWRMTRNPPQISPRYCSSVFIWPRIHNLRKEKTKIWPSISICHVRWLAGSPCLPRTLPPPQPSHLSDWVWSLSSISQSSLDVQNPNAKGFTLSFIWPTGWGERPPFEIKTTDKFLTAENLSDPCARMMCNSVYTILQIVLFQANLVYLFLHASIKVNVFYRLYSALSNLS